MAFNPLQTQANTKPRGIGELLHVQPLSAYEAKQEALLLIHSGQMQRNTKARATIDLLSSAGVLPGAYIAELVGVDTRTLRRYRAKNFVQRLMVPDSLEGLLPVRTFQLYTLGSVGQAVAEYFHGMTPTGYIEAEQDKVSHDLLCNVVYYYLYLGVKVLDYSATLYSRYEASIHDFKGKALLEPDALVKLVCPGKPTQVFLIEYHHEHFSTRTESKVLKYERVLRDHPELWQDKWQTSEPPTILVVWTHNAVGTGYRKYFAERRLDNLRLHARWLGKPLHAFTQQQNVLVWEDLGTAQPQALLIQPV